MSSESHQTRLNGRVAIEMDKVNSKMDPMGRAIADYHKTKKASKLRVFSPMFEEDEIPLTTLFRSYDSMPKIERKALDLAKERMCPSAWSSMREFVESLARGEGNFYDGWMKNPMSAMISCNDGFRPFSFYIEVIE